MLRHPAPINEERLPYVPDEYFELGGKQSEHHLYWPRAEYLGRTALHAAFRQLNTVYVPWDGHQQFHRDFDPPDMPSEEFMLGFVLGSDRHLSARLRKEVSERQRR